MLTHEEAWKLAHRLNKFGFYVTVDPVEKDDGGQMVRVFLKTPIEDWDNVELSVTVRRDDFPTAMVDAFKFMDDALGKIDL